jgi:hypothetical protein
MHPTKIKLIVLFTIRNSHEEDCCIRYINFLLLKFMFCEFGIVDVCFNFAVAYTSKL